MSWLWKVSTRASKPNVEPKESTDFVLQGDANSPASFEKALSKLASQISAANLALDTSRSRGRRIQALWTLYTTLTYLLYTLIIVLVLGPQNWNIYHYAGLASAPVVIYGVRRLLITFFEWRTSRQQAHLEGLQKQREQKIADLKKATKYDSTEELLRKYGGAPPPKTPSKQPQQGAKRKGNPPSNPPEQQQRTGIAPPPTANIPNRNISPTQPSPDMQIKPTSNLGHHPVAADVTMASPTDISPDSPGFAPNAFAEYPPQSSTTYQQAPRWYDRILDVMLGEDETAAKNRLVLLCSRCRLVNGQAPPGIRTLEELGRWRCSGCDAWNGVESESKRVVKEIAKTSHTDNNEDWEEVPRNSSIEEEHAEDASISEGVVTGTEGTTGRQGPENKGVTKRVTRSAGKDASLDSLE
jgi:endoplasmic reticulum junction formation protein lunapark